MYGGSHDTINPSFESGGSYGRFNYFVVGSYNSNNLGIENTTGSPYAIHDRTDQYKLFADLSYIIDDTSRITLLLSGTYSDFQIPNNPNQTRPLRWRMRRLTSLTRSTSTRISTSRTITPSLRIKRRSMT